MSMARVGVDHHPRACCLDVVGAVASALDDRVVHIADGLHARRDQLALLVAYDEHPIARWLQEDEHALESQPVGFHVSVSSSWNSIFDQLPRVLPVPLGERRLPIHG